jgi:cathepsin D
MGGFTVQNQIFGLVNQMTVDLTTGTVAGILGLAFQSLANSGATPWWQALQKEGQFDEPVMSFYLTRCVCPLPEPFPVCWWVPAFDRSNDANRDIAGGQLTIGGTNSSLYTGNINFISLTQAQYWMIPMTSINLQGGQSIALSGSNQNAVIDTGTTLIGGPQTVLDQLYSQISGAVRGSQLSTSLADYYLIRDYIFNSSVA